jgi:hypothetical protein
LHCNHLGFLCTVGHSARSSLEDKGGSLSHATPNVLNLGR